MKSHHFHPFCSLVPLGESPWEVRASENGVLSGRLGHLGQPFSLGRGGLWKILPTAALWDF